MVDRYCSLADIQAHLECTFSSSTSPTDTQVTRWITAAEDEIDQRTHTRWDVHDVADELITPQSATNIFHTKVRPLVSITSLEQRSSGDEFDPTWTAITNGSTTYYKISNSKIGQFKTQEYFWGIERLRINYRAGYTQIPTWLRELTELLVEKRYIMSRLGIAAGESELVSTLQVRIQSKQDVNLRYRLDGLQKEIDARFSSLGQRMKSRNANMSVLGISDDVNKRYRLGSYGNYY